MLVRMNNTHYSRARQCILTSKYLHKRVAQTSKDVTQPF